MLLLWIAFKSLYLWYSKQLSHNRWLSPLCCELLSKVYIFDIRNNTTAIFAIHPPLWIAFKSLYLWYSKQRSSSRLLWRGSCELLSKVYIFDIRNNFHPNRCHLHRVVNCFQKFISLIFETTMQANDWYLVMLWIAFKSLYLWYSKQRAMKI